MCLVFNDSVSDNPAKPPPATKEEKEKNKQDLQLLNEVWKNVTKFPDPNHYISCAEIWIEFTLKNFSVINHFIALILLVNLNDYI